ARVDASAHRLIALPGGGDGPSGVLVCLAGRIEFRHWTAAGGEAAVHGVRIPQLASSTAAAQAPTMVVASAVHRMKGAFFILAQTEAGDLFKITVDYGTADGGDDSCAVRRVGIRYFDTLAAPAASISILRAGFLFAAAGGEAGASHQLLQFENLGSDDDDDDSPDALYFERHAELRSLALVDEVDGASPMLASQVLHVAHGEDAPQIYAACGAGARSSLKIMRHGAEVAELAVSELPAAPGAVWVIGGDPDLIVVSFASSTLVLQAGEDDSLEEAGDALGVALDEATLAVAPVAGGGLVQVTRRAVRHVRADGRVSEW
ncbi:pre-mRNA-splicing factor rse1, partial [Coemansia sp. RSA 2052]